MRKMRHEIFQGAEISFNDLVPAIPLVAIGGMAFFLLWLLVRGITSGNILHILRFFG